MKKIKIITILGTRPEIIRLSKIINILERYTQHKLIHTGQNFDFELNEVFFKDLKIKKPHYKLSYNKKKNLSSIETISTILVNVEKILIKEKPEAIVILGDTNSCLSAYVAKRYKIPIFHIEAGNRCYDQRVPEEINRKIIDHISDVNITYSEIAKENLLRENLPPDRVFKIGSPLHEVYNFHKKKINDSKILQKYSLQKQKYFLLSVHREENIDYIENFNKFINFLKYLNKRNEETIIISTHPRTVKKLRKYNLRNLKNIIFAKPFSYTDYCYLQKNAKIVFSDSGSITEESNIIGFNAVNLRYTNERQEGMSFGAVPMVHFELKKIDNLINFYEKNEYNSNNIVDYLSPNFSKIFLKILFSYIDYINNNVWKK